MKMNIVYSHIWAGYFTPFSEKVCKSTMNAHHKDNFLQFFFEENKLKWAFQGHFGARFCRFSQNLSHRTDSTNLMRVKMAFFRTAYGKFNVNAIAEPQCTEFRKNGFADICRRRYDYVRFSPTANSTSAQSPSISALNLGKTALRIFAEGDVSMCASRLRQTQRQRNR
jgi:hypothetical protein